MVSRTKVKQSLIVQSNQTYTLSITLQETVRKPVKVAFEHTQLVAKHNTSRKMINRSAGKGKKHAHMKILIYLFGPSYDPVICGNGRTLQERKLQILTETDRAKQQWII